MLWEQLTVSDFEKAVREIGVCVIALGVLEKHSEHLPLGTDFLVAQKIATLAAEKEPAVVFPPFYFGQIYEARCFPGCLTIKPALLLELLTGVLDEIGRNGFKKIIIHNGHGGNWNLINFLAQAALWEEKPYSIYVQNTWLDAERKKEWQATLETKEHGHACECETSIVMALYPEYVQKEKIPEKPGESLNRMSNVPYTFSGISWYAKYPDHYCGDARPASAEKGKKLAELMIDSLADYIKSVKDDKAAPLLNKEFYNRVKKIGT